MQKTVFGPPKDYLWLEGRVAEEKQHGLLSEQT